MKKIFFISLGVGILCLFLIHKSWAVWPPETVLEQEALQSTQPASSPSVMDKLAQDENQLAQIIGELKKEVESLKSSSTVMEHKVNSIESKMDDRNKKSGGVKP